MKHFPNPWHDARNELSPREFEVSDEPIESCDVLDFYEVLNEHQRPSVLVVLNNRRRFPDQFRDPKDHRKRVENEVVGQYVTVEGAKRTLLPRTLLHGYEPCDCDSQCPELS